MGDYGLAAIVAVLLWWLGTGLILKLDGLPSTTFGRSLRIVSAACVAAVVGLALIRDQATVFGAYAGFLLGLVIWSWSETSFLTGFVTGVRRQPCPIETQGWRRFVHGFLALVFHELSIAVGALVIAAVSWDAPNQVGLWTYLALWALRTSAKLNLFLGVRNTGSEFLPPHLAYLTSLFGPPRINPLMPMSLLAGLVAAAALSSQALDASGQAFERTGNALVAVLVILGVVEHAFMMTPVSLSALWRVFGLTARGRAGGPGV